MITLSDLSVFFGNTELFSQVSFTIAERDRIALVGRNGAGKSTLLKLIAKQMSPTGGTIVTSEGTTVGYLPQVMNVADDTTLLAEVHKAFAAVQQMHDQLRRMEEQLAQRTDYDSEAYMQLLERYTILNDRYTLLATDNHTAEAERTLTGLGFRRDDFPRPTSEFSGGWRMRIEMAKLLLQSPDVLLLDEPTNHLDIQSIMWLEKFIAQKAGSVVIVSHDRTFLNNTTNRTIELACHRMTDYRVRYSDYVLLRAERREQQQRAYANQQKEIQEAQQFINRFRYKPSKAVQVQQKIKQLEKIVPIEIDEVDTSALRLKFPPCQRSGDFPVICNDVSKTFVVDELPTSTNTIPTRRTHHVFDHVNLALHRGEKVAFVGRNGEGKTTLVRCIMNEIEYDGELKVGHNVQIGYFAQNEAQQLDPTLSVFDTIDHVATGDVRLKIRDMLGAFMFGGEASDKLVRVLSGGERSRLAMLRLLLRPVNLLILDEPTNHLDMHSKDVLKEAIRSFDGTAIIVSHDRDFLNGLVSKVYEFGNGQVREYIGGIYEWCERFNQQMQATDNSSSGITGKSVSDNTPIQTPPHQQSAPQTTEQGMSYAQRKELQRQRSRVEKSIKAAEKNIEQMETRLAELDALFVEPDNAANMVLVSEYTTLKAALDEEMNKWEKLSEELEKIAL
ncbi:MAG: ABC-F family ATP-binding cassette domain-containing protein [Bacteroidaceae bacterium]|nr:ABC-F family ATP-binding cassette domain-containing protein [Bacteroidaceae bacterium]